MDNISTAIVRFLTGHGLELALPAISFLAATFVGYARENRLKAENAKLQKSIDQNKEVLSRQSGIINAVLSQQQKVSCIQLSDRLKLLSGYGKKCFVLGS